MYGDSTEESSRVAIEPDGAMSRKLDDGWASEVSIESGGGATGGGVGVGVSIHVIGRLVTVGVTFTAAIPVERVAPRRPTRLLST